MMGVCSPSLLIILHHIIGLFFLSQDLIREDLFDFQQSQFETLNWKAFPDVLENAFGWKQCLAACWQQEEVLCVSSFPSLWGGGKAQAALRPSESWDGLVWGWNCIEGPQPHSIQTTSPSGIGHFSHSWKCWLKRAAGYLCVGFREPTVQQREGCKIFLAPGSITTLWVRWGCSLLSASPVSADGGSFWMVSGTHWGRGGRGGRTEGSCLFCLSNSGAVGQTRRYVSPSRVLRCVLLCSLHRPRGLLVLPWTRLFECEVPLLPLLPACTPFGDSVTGQLFASPFPGLLPLRKPWLKHRTSRTAVFHALIPLGKAGTEHLMDGAVGVITEALGGADTEQDPPMCDNTKQSVEIFLFVPRNIFHCSKISFSPCLVEPTLAAGCVQQKHLWTISFPLRSCFEQILPEPSRQKVFIFLKETASRMFVPRQPQMPALESGFPVLPSSTWCRQQVTKER